LLAAALLAASALPLGAQPAPSGPPRAAASAAREDALAPAADPAKAPDIAMFINDWHDARPRTESGGLVFHDILTPLAGADPLHPVARGAVLSAITRVSHASLAPGATAAGRMRAGEREIFYATGGQGQLAVNGKSHAIGDGVGFVLTPDFAFRLTSTGKTPLTFYVRTEPVPPGTAASPDVVVTSRWDGDRRVGAHWVHICNGGPAGFLLCTVAPHTMPQPHSHPNEEAWILVKGQSILTLGPSLIRMKPGQAYRIPPTGLDAHSNLNLGDEPIQLLYMGPAVRGANQPPLDYARLDNSPIAPRTAPDVDMYLGAWRDAYPRIVHGNLYLRDMLTALQGPDDLHPTRKGAVLNQADAVSQAMLEPGSTAHHVDGELKGLQQTLVVASGSGTLLSGGKTTPLARGMAVIVGPDTDFRLTATGKDYMTFYVVSERLAATAPAMPTARVIDHRTAPAPTTDWHNRTRPVATRADGLARYAAIDWIEQQPMSMARPTSAPAGSEEIWITLDETEMLLGKQLRKVPAGSAYKVPPTAITARAAINVSARPVGFLRISL
jgi:mannose-6-phosphate isomerase-like protein (cupin superfamily)